MRFLIGIDDTDNLDSRGTGHRARRLGTLLAERGLATVEGVTRHQLLVDSRIPYTSHNSSACIAVSAEEEAMAPMLDCCRRYLLSESAEGSHAGLCLGLASAVTREVQRFGRRAKVEVLVREEAEVATSASALFLEGLTGTGGGVIGALAAVGLRAFGTDGRFLWLPGLRELSGIYTAEELRRVAHIDEVKALDGAYVDGSHTVDVGTWPRPVLVGGRAVLLVEENREDEPNSNWHVAPKEVIKLY